MASGIQSKTGRKRELLASIKALLEMIKQARLFSSQKEQKQHEGVQSVDTFAVDVEINGKAYAVDLIIKKYPQGIFEQRELVDIYYHKIKEAAFPHQGASSMRVPSPEKGLARVGGGSEEDASIPPDLPRNQGGYGRVSGSPSTESLPDESGDVKTLASRAGKKSAISVSFGIKVEEAFTDSMASVWHALSYIKDQTGETLTPDRDPHVLLRLLAGTGGKIDDILERDMIDAKNNRLVFGNLPT